MNALYAELDRRQARIEELERALEALVAADNCNYQRDTMRTEGLFDAARAALRKTEATT
jgi:hypothetical protein